MGPHTGLMGIPTSTPIPIAQYLRMSTEHQRYSTTNQREAIERYVSEHGMEVVQTYEDSGKSGLTLAGRPGLQGLLDDVQSPSRRFEAIVVFDVSRWGRFQDIDESAYYEFLCRRLGVQVLYCAEPFEDNSSPLAVVIKGLKRAMAAEYSRELGAKVLAGQSHLARKGFHVGGFASFGLRRVLVSEEGKKKGILARRQVKSLQTDRVVLEPDCPLDVALIRHIFGLFVRKRMRTADIARALNWAGYPGRIGLHPWRSNTVREVLKNENYVGTLVFNQGRSPLGTPRVKNPPDRWIRAAHSLPAIVSQTTFDLAQRLLREQGRHYWSREELLELIRRVYEKHGTVSPRLVVREGLTCSTIFVSHFGSLADACEAAGVPVNDRLEYQRRLVTTRHALKLEVLKGLARRYESAGVPFIWQPHTRVAYVEGGPKITVRVTQPFCQQGMPMYWMVTPDTHLSPDFGLVGRVSPTEAVVLDYFLLPPSETQESYIRIDGTTTRERLNKYRLTTLDEVFRFLERFRVENLETAVPQLTTNLDKRRRQVLGIKKNPTWRKGR